MASASDQMIKKDLKIHIENTTKKIKDHDGWNMINISELSEIELIRAKRPNHRMSYQPKMQASKPTQ